MTASNEKKKPAKKVRSTASPRRVGARAVKAKRVVTRAKNPQKVSASTKNEFTSLPEVKKEQITLRSPRYALIIEHLGRAGMWVGIGLFAVGILAVVALSVENGFQKASKLAHTLGQTSLLGGSKNSVTLIATGDILLARFVEQNMRKAKDYTFPFKNVADFLKSGDITFGNLETPIFPGLNTPTGSMTFRADAESVGGLTYAGYDVISVANNHTMNYKSPGLLRAIEELSKANIKPVGGGTNEAAARAPAVVEVNGVRVAFLAYNDRTIPPGFHGEAGVDAPGIAPMDPATVGQDITAAKELADIVVVSMHAGREYSKTPTEVQKIFAHAAIDGGASVVIGAHPHVVEPVEYYKEGVIFYSLGNFVFDQYFSEDVRTGLIAKITLTSGGKPTVELFPTRIAPQTVQPRILEGEAREKVLTKWSMTTSGEALSVEKK